VSASGEVNHAQDGRLKHKQPYHSHILTSKTAKRKRQLRASVILSEAETKCLRRLLPYL
jgi:large subunit ribosomal protein L35